MAPIHVAVISDKGSGHLNPLVELSLRLLPLGFSVSFLISKEWMSMLRDKSGDKIRFVPIPDCAGPMMLSPELQKPIGEIIQALEPPVSYLISDFFLGWSYDLAKSLGIPNIALVATNAVTEILCCYLPELGEKGYLSQRRGGAQEELITFIPALKPFHPSRLPLGFFDHIPMRSELTRAAPRVREAFCVLVNTIEELEQEVVTARRSEIPYYLPVGPLLPEDLLKDETPATVQEENPCLQWLDKQSPGSVLYVAFGSVVSLTLSKVEKLAQALEASQHKFLWAIRRNFSMDTPESFFERLETKFGGQGLVVEWAPQVQVLRHPSVRGFLSHCGWNSTMESICAGVPILCWPCSAEQNVNALNIVNEWKIGLQLAEGLPDEVLEVDQIENIIRDFMGGGRYEEIKEGVKSLRRIVLDGRCSKQNLLRLRNLCLKGD